MGVAWQRSGAGEDTTLRRRWKEGEEEEEGGVVCPRRQMAWGAGPWWAGAGRAPCAVVGNWGPGWNVGGTLILSATVFLRHRSPLPPPICSFHRSYGKRSRTHTHAHQNIHGQTCAHARTHIRHTLPPANVQLWVQLQCISGSTPNIPPPRLTELASRFDQIPPASATILCHTDCLCYWRAQILLPLACVILHKISFLPHVPVDALNLCWKAIMASGN